MARPKSNKTKLTLWVDKNLVALAKRKIGNLSAFFEIKVLEHLKLGNNGIKPRAGFEPATFALPRQRSTS